MALFGSREDDPLLQNDPFAPPSEGDSVSSDDRPDGGASGEGDDGSVFEERDSVEAQDSDTRVLSCSTEEATTGELAAVNQALSEGWRLDHVELRDGATEIAFVLRRKGEPSDPFDGIV